MKSVCLLSLILCFSFWGCNNDDCSYGVDDYVSTSFIAKVENSEEIQSYLESCSTLFSRVEDLNSKIEKEDLKELSELYLLCKSEPQVYKTMLEEKVSELYCSEDLKMLDELYNNVLKNKELVSESQLFTSLSLKEKSDLNQLVVFEMPFIQKQLFNKPLTRGRDEEAACVRECNRVYNQELIDIAFEVVCSSGAAVIEACSSLGIMTVVALIQLIITYGDVVSGLDEAQADYEHCKSDCVAMYGTN